MPGRSRALGAFTVLGDAVTTHWQVKNAIVWHPGTIGRTARIFSKKQKNLRGAPPHAELQEALDALRTEQTVLAEGAAAREEALKDAVRAQKDDTLALV